MKEIITSKQNEKIKEIVKLSKQSEKEASQQFIVEGYHLLEMALEAKVVLKVLTLKEIKDLPNSIPQYIVTPEIMDKISSLKSPQGVLAVCSMKKEQSLSNDRILYLDDISDPGNMGTLLRTALAFGYKDIIVSHNSTSIYNEKVVQSSQGAIFKLNIIKGDASTLKNLKDYEILSTEIKGSLSLKEVKHQKKIVLVLGNESRGVSKEILNISHQRIRIDIKDIESLNVAIAGAIAMYSL